MFTVPENLLRVSRKMVLLALPVLAGTPLGTLWAGINEWTSVGPEGGQIRALSIDPHNPATTYAATDYGGAFKSVNRGVSWMKSDAPNGVSYLTRRIRARYTR